MQPLCRSHLELAQTYWKALVQPGDIVIDATAGNGYDTLFLAKQVLCGKTQPHLFVLDIQPEALESTQQRLKENFPQEHLKGVCWLQHCHSSLPAAIPTGQVKLIVYNLGYLPGGNKNLTTMCDTTLTSLECALPLISPGGMISVTCYPGHAEGKQEEQKVLEFASKLSPFVWTSCHHQWLNRKAAPSLLILQRNLQ